MKRKSILLVEDDEGLRSTLRDIIEEEYRVLEASGYSEAVKQLKNHQVDLALVDYILPGADGFELINEIKKFKPSLPVIVMTGFTTENVLINAVRAGVKDYFKKPLDIAHVKRRLSDILEDRDEADCYEGTQQRDFIIDSIAIYIEQYYMKNITLDNLAEKAGMSRFKFCRAFKDRLGQGFKSYLTDARVRNAAELLRKSNLSIAEIIYASGFDNLVHFYRVFREAYGMSPREYRNNNE